MRVLFIGVDGCRAGWVAAAIGDDEGAPGPGPSEAAGAAAGMTVSVHRRIDEVWACYGERAAELWIDMPVGLPGRGAAERRCDREAQALLGRRASSIFPAPCREALEAPDYAAASAANRAVLGRGLSRQSFHLIPKIREVDDWLARSPAAVGRVRESHPELCFAELAGRPLASRKQDAAGVLERFALLAAMEPRLFTLLAALLAAHAPAAVQAAAAERRQPRLDGAGADDVLDACVLAVCARLAATTGRLASVPAVPQTDALGLPMRIVRYRPDR